jgi:hypothetical protein
MVSYGSGARPAALDPFQTIVEVGWGARYVAIRTFINGTFEVDEEFCTTPIGVPPADHHGVYLTSTDYVYPGEQVIDAAVYHGTWSLIDSDEVEVAGMPVLPGGHQDYAAWERHSTAGQPFAQWVQPAATETGIPTPDGQANFDDILAATIEMHGRTYTSGPTGCYQASPSAAIQKEAPFSADFSAFAPFVVSFAGMTLTYRNRPYVAIALHVANASAFAPGAVWVLFERDQGSA